MDGLIDKRSKKRVHLIDNRIASYRVDKRKMKKIAADSAEENNFGDESAIANTPEPSTIEQLVMAPGTQFIPEKKPQMNGQTKQMQMVLQNLANEGRGVLKRIEDYKFILTQSANMLNGNEDLQHKVEQKINILDSASSQLYGIVFDLENFDLTPNYEEEQLSLKPPKTDTGEEEEEETEKEDEFETGDFADVSSDATGGGSEGDSSGPSGSGEGGPKMQGGFEAPSESSGPSESGSGPSAPEPPASEPAAEPAESE